jgi:hypothetical protein
MCMRQLPAEAGNCACTNPLVAMARTETYRQFTMTEKTLIKNISIVNEGHITVADLMV